MNSTDFSFKNNDNTIKVNSKTEYESTQKLEDISNSNLSSNEIRDQINQIL